jgi:hypothetical protein
MNPQRLAFFRRPVPARVLALTAVLAMCLAGWTTIALTSPPARAASQAPAGLKPDLGTWNYDQPSTETMTNIAVASCPAGTPSCASVPPISLPQIGYVVFSAGPGGSVLGHTDQGCTWRFTPVPGGLELSRGAAQSCFNHVIGSSYTMTRWSVRFSGRHETEYITAVSHLSYGNFDFVLKNGKRTRAQSGPAAVRRFTGYWQYTTADPETGLNIKTTVYPAPVGQVRSPLTGPVTFTPRRGDLISARTADGCTWTLAVAGNTAELRPAKQACTRDGATKTMSFWSIASNGSQQVSVIAGTDPKGGSYLASGFRLALAPTVYTNEKSASELGQLGLSKVLTVPSQRHFQGEE